jgi:hypothetical protein
MSATSGDARIQARPADAPAPITEVAELARELATLAEGDPWHGPALADLLDGVSAETAAARPIPAAHTIWDLVLHITAWTDVFRRRLEGTAVEEPEAGDFPVPPAPTARAWDEARDGLFTAHRAFTECVAGLSPAQLRAPVPGRNHDMLFLVRGAIRHTVYHSGQIGLLRKASPRAT